MSLSMIGVIGIFLIIMLGGFLNNRIKWDSVSAVIFILFALFLGVGSWKIAGLLVQIPTEKIYVTASEEKSVGEVFLEKYVVDSKEYKVSKPIEGKWVKRGEKFGWIDSEETVIEGITRTAVFEIPIGWERELFFEKSNIAGNVKVECENKIIEKKLESEKEGSISVKIGSTSKMKIYAYKLKLLGVYAFVYLVFIAFLSCAYQKWKKERVRCINIMTKWRYHVFYLTLALVTFCYLLYNADFASFWFDEMFTLGYAMSEDIPNSSFISFELLRIIYKIMPYGQRYLLLVPIICYAVSVYVLGIIGKMIRNGRTGVYAAACLGFASYAYKQVAFEYRTYFMLVLFAVVTLYFFIRRLQSEKISWVLIIAYGISLLMLMDSHEYGKVVAGYFVLFDFILLLKKKVEKKNLFSDLFAIGYGIIWLVFNQVGGMWNNYSWPSNPNPIIVYNTFWELCGRSNLLVYLFVLGSIMIVICTIQKCYNANSEFASMNHEYIPLLLVCGVFCASIVYSNYINPENSLYLNRYFTSVLGYIFLVVAVAIDELVILVSGNRRYVKDVLCLWCVIIIGFQGWQMYLSMPYITNQLYRHQDYRGTAEWVNQQKDVYDKKTLVYIAEDRWAALGWWYYYTQNGEYDVPNLANNHDAEVKLEEYDVIYLVQFMHSMPQRNKDMLDDKFELVENVQDVDKGLPIYKYKRK